MNKEKLIKYFQSVLPMSPDAALRLCEKFQYQEVEKGEYLLKENKICNETRLLETGFVRSFTLNTEGVEVTTAIYNAPCMINSLQSFFKRQPCRENLQTITDCKIWSMTYENVQTQFHSIPEFREWGRMMLINGNALLQDRMFGMIQLTAEQRYAQLMQTNPEIFQNVPLKMIASYLGVTDSSLSRIRKLFSKK